MSQVEEVKTDSASTENWWKCGSQGVLAQTNCTNQTSNYGFVTCFGSKLIKNNDKHEWILRYDQNKNGQNSRVGITSTFDGINTFMSSIKYSVTYRCGNNRCLQAHLDNNGDKSIQSSLPQIQPKQKIKIILVFIYFYIFF